MAKDPASLFDTIVNNEKVPVGAVSLLLYLKIALIVIVGGSFFALNAGSIAIIAVLVAFIAALNYARTTGGGSILRSNQTPFQEAVAYWLPQFIFFLPGVLAVLEGVLSAFVGGQSFAFSFGATETYLSFISDADPWFVDVVNYDLATHVENWLIIPSGALIAGFVVRYTDLSLRSAAVIGAVPMAIIFALLHGLTVFAFTLFAFGFMFLLIAGIGYEDAMPGPQIPLGLATLVASIGWHRGFNIGSLNELFAYYGELLSLTGDFQLIGYGIVAIDVIILILAVIGGLLWLGDRF